MSAQWLIAQRDDYLQVWLCPDLDEVVQVIRRDTGAHTSVDEELRLDPAEAVWLFRDAGPLVLIALQNAEAEARERRRA